MAQRNQSSAKTVTRRYRRDIGGAWWTGLVAVSVLLGLLGRRDSGFWSVFLWSVVGFVMGSLTAMGLAGRLVPARSEDEAFAGVGAVDRAGVER